MTINELAAKIHENAVAHGWWEENRPKGEVISLIHSEWSEALEEARAGRPMVWYACADCGSGPCAATPDTAAYACGFDKSGRKPEGIGVELADGCIRILDYLAHIGVRLEFNSLSEMCERVQGRDRNLSLSACVAELHWYTSCAYIPPKLFFTAERAEEEAGYLCAALAIACVWIAENGGDAEKIILEKHTYNVSRPYKHGKKF